METTRNSENSLVLEREVTYTERPAFPKNMLVELTNACNHRCVFCGYKDMHRKVVRADKVFLKEKIKEAYNEGTREIGFYMIGEPFLSDDLPEYVSYSKELGFTYIYLTSNGAKATPEKLKQVIDAGIDSIKFSINGGTEDSYAKVHGADDFNTVKENIKWLRNYLDEKEITLKTFITFVKCNYNKNDEDLLHRIFDELVDKVYILECANQGGAVGELVQNGVAEKIVPASIPCEMVFNRLHITAEGFLDACCADTNGNLVVADLHKMTLKEAWYCEEFISLRKQHLSELKIGTSCYNCAHNTNHKIIPLVPNIVG